MSSKSHIPVKHIIFKPKWKVASVVSGSRNTADIGSINVINQLLRTNLNLVQSKNLMNVGVITSIIFLHKGELERHTRNSYPIYEFL